VNRDDDPEARIRELERGLNDQARASELGGGRAGSDTPYMPSSAPAYTPPDYSTQAYGSAPPYGNQQYDTQQYGQQPYGQFPSPQRKSSGGIPWAVFGLIAVLFIGGAVAGAIFYTSRSGDGSSVSSGGGSVDVPSIPSYPSFPSIEIPSIPAVPGAPSADPTVIVASPGEDVSVAGIDENKTVTCNDGSVTISGIRNTVNVIGHCVKVGVSGMNNVVTVDAADTIGASGFDNRITYHSGSPQVDATGSNVVEQG
jgi:Protein of unknown function (DUF3060)